MKYYIHSFYAFIAAVCALGGWSSDVYAQAGDDPDRPPDTPMFILEPIEATAARERATAPPVATIRVDPEQVRSTQAENPYDLIRRVSGIEVHDQGQGPGFSSNVVMRGFTSDHSSDVLLTVDGVPVNLPVHGHVEGYADWSFLFPGAVSSLRIIHGPSSPLHGDFSIAGAVELYTQSDADGVEASLSANGFGDLSGWITAGMRGERGGGLVGFDARRMEGWRDNSEREIGNLLLRGWRTVGDGRVEGGLALHGARWGAPGFLSMQQFEDRLLEGAADPTDGGDQERLVVHGRYAAPVGPDRFVQVMAWGIASDLGLHLTTPGHEDALGNLYQSSEFDRRWGAGSELEYSWIPTWGEITLGTSVRTDRAEYDKDRTFRTRPIEGEVALDAEHTAAGVYLRWRHTVSDRLGLDLGGRLDHLRYRSYNRLGLDEGGQSAAAIPDPRFPISFHIIGDQGPLGSG
jgi:outer membrane receptor protein involved in Fe transport